MKKRRQTLNDKLIGKGKEEREWRMTQSLDVYKTSCGIHCSTLTNLKFCCSRPQNSCSYVLLVTPNLNTAWCSEIGSLTSLDAPELHASSDVREPISLHQAVCALFFMAPTAAQQCTFTLSRIAKIKCHLQLARAATSVKVARQTKTEEEVRLRLNLGFGKNRVHVYECERERASERD